jgi:ABC-type transport system involved in multi-copper enzyme maturation permease subunit
MEKYNDSTSPSQESSDFENASLLNTNYMKQESQRRRNYVYLTLFNLFIFTLSMLSIICAVMSQKDTSSASAAKLMDQFGLTSPAMHEIEYSRVKFELASPLNSSKYVGITDDVENAWMDVAYRNLPLLPHLSHPLTLRQCQTK